MEYFELEETTEGGLSSFFLKFLIGYIWILIS